MTLDDVDAAFMGGQNMHSLSFDSNTIQRKEPMTKEMNEEEEDKKSISSVSTGYFGGMAADIEAASIAKDSTRMETTSKSGIDKARLGLETPNAFSFPGGKDIYHQNTFVLPPKNSNAVAVDLGKGKFGYSSSISTIESRVAVKHEDYEKIFDPGDEKKICSSTSSTSSVSAISSRKTEKIEGHEQTSVVTSFAVDSAIDLREGVKPEGHEMMSDFCSLEIGGEKKNTIFSSSFSTTDSSIAKLKGREVIPEFCSIADQLKKIGISPDSTIDSRISNIDLRMTAKLGGQKDIPGPFPAIIGNEVKKIDSSSSVSTIDSRMVTKLGGREEITGLFSIAVGGEEEKIGASSISNIDSRVALKLKERENMTNMHDARYVAVSGEVKKIGSSSSVSTTDSRLAVKIGGREGIPDVFSVAADGEVDKIGVTSVSTIDSKMAAKLGGSRNVPNTFSTAVSGEENKIGASSLVSTIDSRLAAKLGSNLTVSTPGDGDESRKSGSSICRSKNREEIESNDSDAFAIDKGLTMRAEKSLEHSLKPSIPKSMPVYNNTVENESVASSTTNANFLMETLPSLDKDTENGNSKNSESLKPFNKDTGMPCYDPCDKDATKCVEEITSEKKKTSIKANNQDVLMKSNNIDNIIPEAALITPETELLLPDANEYDPATEMTPIYKNKRIQKWTSLILVVACILATTIGLIVSKKLAESRPDEGVHLSVYKTPLPTKSPNSSPLAGEHLLLKQELERFGIYMNNDTALNEAFDWMKQDKRFLAFTAKKLSGIELIPSDDDYVDVNQRFVTCLFYFTMSGDNWKTCSRKRVNGGTEYDDDKCVLLDEDGNDTEGKFWLSNHNECEWGGISCSINGKVNRMALDNLNLAGPITPYLTNFTKLEFFHLKENSITGTIPAEIGQMSSLRVIELNGNKLSGFIPQEMYSLIKLESLNLGANYFKGQISSRIGNFKNLLSLVLHFNMLTGSLPTEIGLLTTLEALFLTENDISGSLPTSFETLHSLHTLLIAQNNFTGDLILPNSPDLDILDVQKNSFAGSLPQTFYTLSHARFLYFGSNYFSGGLKSDVGNLNNTVTLHLQDNLFTGSIPKELSLLKGLIDLRLHKNNFMGIFPTDVCHIQMLDIHVDCLNDETLGYSKINCTCCKTCCDTEICQDHI